MQELVRPLNAFAVLVLGCLLLAACAHPQNLQTRYLDAVADARTVSAAKISRQLTPINNENPALIWENGVIGSRVLVVSWMDEEGVQYRCTAPEGCGGNAECLEGGECPAYRHDTWVTVVPELKRMLGARPEPLRVAQALGLPPEAATPGAASEYKYMVELWVSPRDLFRPCPDTEISDTMCETDFPTGCFRGFDTANTLQATAGPDQGVFMAYPAWFENQARHSYTEGADPYPWTRLGYTYDWGSRTHVGLSEFVLHGRKADNSSISVGIKSVKTTAEYFGR